MAGGVGGPGEPRVEGIGEVSTGCVLWLAPGRACATLVVKATFALVPDGSMVRTRPEPIVAEEQTHDGSPARSLRRTIDLALFSARTDVVVTGHAWVPGGRWAPRLPVRLAVYRGAALLDKSLVVYGDRLQGQPKPFQKMPVVYERAYGGVGYPENPLGRGFGDDKQPNIELPERPGVMAGFGPIGRSWAARRKMLGAAARKAVMAPVPEVGADFDWSYFQAAPPDQQIAGIVGDEWLVLEGMHPDHPRLQSCLPGVSAEMFLHGPDLVEPTPVGPTAFRADLVSIDADAGTCSVTWRAVICAERPEQLASVRVMVGVAERSAPIAWPAPSEIVARWEAEDAAAESDAAPTARLPPKRSLDHTLTLSGVSTREEPVPAPLPFAVAGAAAGAGPVPAPFPSPVAAAAAPVQGRNLGDTIVTPWNDPPAGAGTGTLATRAPGPSAAPALPFHAGTRTLELPAPALARAAPQPRVGEVTLALDPPVAPPPAAPAPDPVGSSTGRIQKFTTTLAAEPDRPAGGIPKAAIPFVAIGPGVSAAAGDTIPGAPWPSRARATRSPKLPPRVPPKAPLHRTGAVPMLFREALTGVAIPSSLQPPQPSITVVVKGTFDLVPGGRATLRAESEPPRGDVHAGEAFVSSLLYPSDLALFKPVADVLLVGHAYPAERRARHSHVRFRFGKKGGFDRRAAVIGDRFWEGGVPSTPASFTAIPLVHERAFGGPETPANPAGRGRIALPDGRVPMPNLEDPEALVRSVADAPEPVAFCGVPMRWPARWSKLGTYAEATAADRWPHFAEDFDWTFFQAAPPAQRLPQVDGDEPFLLAGVHPQHAVLEGELPHLSVRCFAQLTKIAGGRFHEVFLRLDTVVFAPDTLTLHLVWRGVLEVSDDDAPEIESLFVMTRPMKERAATLAEAQAAYAEAVREKEAAPAEAAPAAEPIEPDVEAAPEEADAPPESGTQAKVDRHLEELHAKVAALGVTLPPLDDAAPPPAPATLDPEAAFAKMRAGGMKEQDIAELRESLRDLPPPDAPPETAVAPETQEAPPEPESDRLTRAAVIAMLATDASFDGLDLSELDLSELDFSGRSLARARLGDACLFAAKLPGAKLTEAHLGKADLRQVDLTGADLTGADLHGVDMRGARLGGATLDGADLSACHAEGATFEKARGQGVSFWGASLPGARLSRAELPAADFTSAHLDDASFEDAVLTEVRLYDAVGRRTSFRGASMKGARAEGAAFPEGRFRGANADGSIWDDADLEGAVFLGASLVRASFLRAGCEGAVLANADLEGAQLARARLANASFSKSKLANASFDGADLTRADLRGACLHRAETWKAKLRGANTDGAIVTRTRLARRA